MSSQRSRLNASQQSQISSVESDYMGQLVSDLVVYMLVANRSKSVIKRTTIVAKVLGDTPKAFDIVLPRAQKILSDVYGFKMIYLDKKGYILVNNFTIKETRPSPYRTEDECTTQGLLVLILGCIFMNGNTIREELLWSFLDRFSIEKERHHPVFSHVKKQIAEFERQLYLEHYTASTIDNIPQIEYRWGPRAQHEVSKKELLDLICKIFNTGVKPHEWVSQFKQVTEEESKKLPPQSSQSQSDEQSQTQDDSQSQSTQRKSKRLR